MNTLTVLSVFCIIVAAVSAGHVGYGGYGGYGGQGGHAGLGGHAGHNGEDNGPAHYQFEYGVYDPHTGDKKEQHEVRNGHALKGLYTFKEADGTTRVVEYVSDPHKGFNAVVKRIGKAQHPQHYKVYGDDGKVSHGGSGHHGGEGGAYSHVGVTHFGYNHH